MGDYVKGDRVRYVAAPVFDLIIDTGEVGVVERVVDGWVYACGRGVAFTAFPMAASSQPTADSARAAAGIRRPRTADRARVR